MKKNMEKEETCTIKEYEDYYLKEYHDEEGKVVRDEAYLYDSDKWHHATDYFYDPQGNCVLQFEEMINSDLHLHFRSETHFRHEGVFYIVETVTRFLSTPIGQRDEKRIEVMSGTRCAARTYDLETGVLVSDELWDGDHCLREHRYGWPKKVGKQTTKK